MSLLRGPCRAARALTQTALMTLSPRVGRDDRSTPVPPPPAEVKELSFSVKKLKKRDSELSAGFVIQCDATGCQLRKKISTTVSPYSPPGMILDRSFHY